MILFNATKKTLLADRCHFANTVLKRMIGLLNRRRLEPGEALLIDRCYGIHTFGMRFPIDVLFLDHDLRVLRVVEALPPYRTCAVKRAVYVLELPIGSVRTSQTEQGDQIQLRVAEPSRDNSAAATISARA